MDVSSNSLSWSTSLSENKNRNSMIDYGTKRLSDSFMSSHPRKPLSACDKENDRNSTACGANDRNSTARGANYRNSTDCNSNAARGARVRRAEPIVVCVTGATGQIGYALLPHIADGACFGRTQPIILKLLCTNETTANGVKMELEDLACPLLVDTVVTLDAATAFTGADYAILLGAAPRGPGM